MSQLDQKALESRWLETLARARDWTPQTAGLVVVSPHPDDQVLAAGGLIHSWASAGRTVTIVSVTDGEAAAPHQQLKAALRKLSLTHVTVLRVGLPNGKVIQHRNRLRNSLLAVLDPSVTLVAPFERDGHPDHDAIGEICGSLARCHGLTLARYPISTWHHSDPAAFLEAPWVKFPLSLEARRSKARAVKCFTSPPPPVSHLSRPFEAFLM